MDQVPQPSFIVAGGVRCATGWIRSCLIEHPEVYMTGKETHFFDQNFEKGIEWYTNFFKDHRDQKSIGEKTASYLHNELVASRIKKTLPDIKLIFCLRDPVERMYSHITMIASNDDTLNIQDLLDSQKSGSKYIEWGKYAQQLRVFFDKIPHENMLIQIYEDKDRDPYGFMSEIYRFIGVNPNFKAPSTLLRTKLGQFEHTNKFWGGISKIMLHPRGPHLFRSIYTKMRPNAKKSILSEDINRQFSKHYKEDIFLLEDLIDRDLSQWSTKRFVET
jgi:hypothetical protein